MLDMKNTKNNHIKHWDTRGRTGSIQKNGYKMGQVFFRRIYEHRKVMEEFIGRKLSRSEHVHHINGDKLDNRIENLEILSSSEHTRRHAIKNGLGKDRVGIEPTNKTPIEIRELVYKLRENGKSLIEIKEKTGLSFPTIIKYAKKTTTR